MLFAFSIEIHTPASDVNHIGHIVENIKAIKSAEDEDKIVIKRLYII